MRALRSTWGSRFLAVCLAAGLLLPLAASAAATATCTPQYESGEAALAGPVRTPLAQWAGRAGASLHRLATASLSDLSRSVGGALPATYSASLRGEHAIGSVPSHATLWVLALRTLSAARSMGP